jgi:hypothetical protein
MASAIRGTESTFMVPPYYVITLASTMEFMHASLYRESSVRYFRSLRQNLWKQFHELALCYSDSVAASRKRE